MLPSTSSNAPVRPPSSLSTLRPVSRTSTRPHSRLSTRPYSRHARSRLISLCQTLVTQVTSLEEKEGVEDGADFHTAVEFAVKNLEATTLSKGAVSVDMGVIDRQIRGHALKARLNSQDELGEALETCYKELKIEMEGLNDLDQEITKTRFPDQLQFLIKLSEPPSNITIHQASLYLHNRANPPLPPAPLTWAAIVAEEPFEGEHWEGVYGLPAGFVRRRGTGEEEGKGVRYDREKESERLDWDSRWSTPSLSPLNSGDLELDEEDDSSDDNIPPSIINSDMVESHSPLPPVLSQEKSYREPPHTYAHRKEVDALKGKQYWRDVWKGDGAAGIGKKAFDIGDASTLGPTLSTVLHSAADKTRSLGIPVEVLLENEKYINEEDAVREILMSLQGRRNIMLQWKGDDGGGAYTAMQPTPRLIHLSLASQASMTSSLAHAATTIQRLRNFTANIFEHSQVRPRQPLRTRQRGNILVTTRTLEAFADAVDAEIRTLDKWCASREEVMCRAWGGFRGEDGQPLVISLLRTENDLQNAFGRTFEALLDMVKEVYPSSIFSATALLPAQVRSAAVVSSILLDRLFENVQEYLERQEDVTSEALMRVFVRTAEPVWGMIGRWLRDGMGLGVGMNMEDGIGIAGGELDEEFFIESNLGIMGMGLLDAEFWKEGYALRDGVLQEGSYDDEETDGQNRGRKTIPMFLEHVAEPVLGAGKAVGLLRALGVPLASISPMTKWKLFRELVGLSSPTASLLKTPSPAEGDDLRNRGSLFSVSIDNLSRLIYDSLLPLCETAGALLVKILVDECSLWSHLGSIENLFLMRRGDAMSHFTDILFAKMDTSQSWGDLHFLNTAFRDVVESGTHAGEKAWVQTSLVRLLYRGGKDKDKAVLRTVKAIEGLVVEYAVPFPLTYIFRPSTISIYSEILVFLLQIRRAKSVLERILVRGEAKIENLRGDLKAFYAMRSRLSWFINTLLNFLSTHVIHAQVTNFHKAFRAAKSLDEMIQCHDNHLDKIQGRCLLKSNTNSLHRVILSILDMSLQFSEFFISFSGNTATTHDVSRQSVFARRHRSRRQKRQRRNIIGFSQSLQDSLDSSDESNDDLDMDADGINTSEQSFSMTASVSLEEGVHTRLDKMSFELDGLVRFLRRGVETLAGSTGEAAPAFGVLAFALEDWDN